MQSSSQSRSQLGPDENAGLPTFTTSHLLNWWTVSPDQNPRPQNDPPGDVRGRLSRVPNIDEVPIESTWLNPGQSLGRTAPPIISPDPAVPTEPPLPEEPRRRRLRFRWILFGFALLVIAGLGIPACTAWQTFGSIERVPVSDVLVPATAEGRNVLLVGTDSRAGIETDQENAGLILGAGTVGERSDTIIVVNITDDGSKMLSLPRDLWLPINSGSPQRINTAIAQGPEAVIRTIDLELGIAVSSYVQIDLAGFIDLVDAVGGVTITIPHPAFDRASGLDLPVAGEVELDSAQALAFVRSRRYTEIIDGREVGDPTSDLGRVARQQDFIRALLDELTNERNPLVLNDALGSMADAVVLDDRTTFSDVLDIAQTLRTGLPASVVVPTQPASIGGRSVLQLRADSEEVLQEFRIN